jgi:sugar O-acyltransferase (sialic acid O-acetyltransferase NeuD family)
MSKVSNEIYIIGAGGHGKVAIRAAQAQGYRVAAVFDDDPGRVRQTVCGVPIVGNMDALRSHLARPTLVAIGDNALRLALVEQLDLPWLTLVHPAAFVDGAATIGLGTIVLAKAVVQVDVVIGDHAIVNDNATVEHDCVVGTGAHISCNACLTGGVHVGRGALIGAGAVVLPGIRIGDFAIVGAGAVVTTDVPADVTVVGNPARILGCLQKSNQRATLKVG